MTDPQWDFGQDYELLGSYPAGAGGSVWLVRARQDGAERAIKVLRPELSVVAEAVDDFCALLGALGQLAHPGILVADETVVHEGRVALVTGRMPGEDLRTLLDRRQVLTPASTVLMVADICDALAAAHTAGIVHGDVKPSNVLVDLDPDSGTPRSVRLADFGIAGLATRGAVAVLPAEYQAPETDAEQQLVTPASDVYAVGVVLYEALAGRPPFVGADPDGIARLHREAQPPRIPALPDQLWLLIAACLAKQAEQRPAAAELTSLLREIAPTIAALPALVTQDTVRIERITIAPVARPAMQTSVVPVVPAALAVPVASAVSTAIAPIEVSPVEQSDAPRRSALSGPRGIALAAFSGVVVVAVGLALIHASGHSAPDTQSVGSATLPSLALGSASAGFTSTVTTTLTPTATKSVSASGSASPTPTPSPDEASRTASPTGAPSTSTAASSPSASASTVTTAAVAVSTAPSTATTSAAPTTGPVTVTWQCATNEANPAGISKTACIGLGSDGALYIQGTFTASNSQIISDIKVSVAAGGQYIDTTSESCGTSSCSITGGPYEPTAGTYQAYAGIDNSAHNEVSPNLVYTGG